MKKKLCLLLLSVVWSGLTLAMQDTPIRGLGDEEAKDWINELLEDRGAGAAKAAPAGQWDDMAKEIRRYLRGIQETSRPPQGGDIKGVSVRDETVIMAVHELGILEILADMSSYSKGMNHMANYFRRKLLEFYDVQTDFERVEFIELLCLEESFCFYRRCANELRSGLGEGNAERAERYEQAAYVIRCKKEQCENMRERYKQFVFGTWDKFDSNASSDDDEEELPI